MTQAQLKKKIRNVLKKEFAGEKDKIVIRDGFEDCLHLFIVSPKFKGKPHKKKGEIIWSILFQSLAPEEWGKITLTAGYTPKEVNGTFKGLEVFGL